MSQVDTILFLDETGDHSLGTVDPNFPIFLLCGCLFTHDSLNDFTTAINALKKKYWRTENVIFHSRDIRKCNEPFHIFFDQDIKKSFYNDLNNIINDTKFTVFAAAIKKDDHVKRYGKVAGDPYDISLSFIMERVVFYLSDESKKHSKPITCNMMLEKRGDKEDVLLTSHFNKVRDRGTGYVEAARMQQHILGCSFNSKLENHAGLQSADLCAYPLARSLVLKGSPSKAADIVDSKIYRNFEKKYGLKVFP